MFGYRFWCGCLILKVPHMRPMRFYWFVQQKAACGTKFLHMQSEMFLNENRNVDRSFCSMACGTDDKFHSLSMLSGILTL